MLHDWSKFLVPPLEDTDCRGLLEASCDRASCTGAQVNVALESFDPKLGISNTWSLVMPEVRPLARASRLGARKERGAIRVLTWYMPYPCHWDQAFAGVDTLKL